MDPHGVAEGQKVNTPNAVCIVQLGAHLRVMGVLVFSCVWFW